jgi:hypothetical protein
MKMNEHQMLVSDLRQMLSLHADDEVVAFVVYGTPIHLMRAKSRGKKFLQLEFSEIEGHPLGSQQRASSNKR